MKRVIYSLLGAAALSVSAFTAMSITTTATAQKKGEAPVILSLSLDQVIAQSKAGKYASGQIEEYRKSVAAELTSEQEAFKRDVEAFQKNQELYSEETLKQKVTELRIKERQIPGMAQAMDQVFSASIQKVRFDITKEIEPILVDISDKRSATLVVDRAQIIYAAPETDITQEVVSQLDKKIKTVDVEKVSLADLKKQAEEAAKNAQ